MTYVAVIDYGTVNLKNIIRGLEFVGARVRCVSKPFQMRSVDCVVLPGVGSFKSGINELRSSGMDDAIKLVAELDKPLLGICLGMQMLLEVSFEHGRHEGLGIIQGSVEKIPDNSDGDRRRKIPHVGWNTLNPNFGEERWKDTCLNNVTAGAFCYFSHSYMAIPTLSEHILATTNYDGARIVAGVGVENITGLQFHPELSGPVGLEILKQFVAV